MTLLVKYEELKLKYRELEKKYLELVNLIDEEFWDELGLRSRVQQQ